MAKGAYIGVPTRTNPLSQFDIGSIVNLKVGGVPTDFIVVHQGNPDSNLYDSSCDGTWLLMKDIYEKRVWSSSDVGYQNSTIHSYLNGEFLGLFDSDVQSAIKQVKIPYYSGASSTGTVYSGSNGLSTKVFLLSALELGFDESGYSYLPTDGVALSYFSGLSYADTKRSANYQGEPATWWLRSRRETSTYNPIVVLEAGGHNYKNAYSTSHGIRPAIILPSNFGVGDMVDVARKVKNGYIGIGNVAHKIKKAYIGIGGVARPCFGDKELVYYGAITPLQTARYGAAGATIGDYALFSGGSTSTSGSYTHVTDAYNSALTRSTPTGLGATCWALAATTVGDYALFGGGKTSSARNNVNAYNASLTRTNPTTLSDGRQEYQAITVGNYALFGGGSTSTNGKKLDAYDASLTRNNSKSFSTGRYANAAATVGNYAIFAGGYYSSALASTEVFDSSLTKTSSTALSVDRRYLIGASVGEYALFAGGFNASSVLGTVDVYNSSLTRTTAASLSQARQCLIATTLGKYALFGGGTTAYNDSSATKLVESYDEQLTRNIMENGLPKTSRYPAAATIGKYALFAGGTNGSVHSDVTAYMFD